MNLLNLPFVGNVDAFLLKQPKKLHLCWLFEKLGLPVPRYFVGWSNLGGGDHGGAAWTISGATAVAGVHTNVGAFTVNNGVTATVQAWNGASYGTFEVQATSINIIGTIYATGKGFGGGGGGGGGNGYRVDAWTNRGVGTASGSNGGNGGGYNWSPPYSGGNGGGGGHGGGTYGGHGGGGGAGGDTGGEAGAGGSAGGRGGYAVTGGQGDGTTNETLLKGGAGAGGGAGGGGCTDPGAGCNGGAGGGGNRGGGYVKLIATTTLTVSGAIYAKGLDNSAGNGGVGSQGVNAAGSCGSVGGGCGGSAAAGGGSNGGAGATDNNFDGIGGFGGAGAEGGYGAGGGILLKCGNVEGYMNLDGTLDNRGGANATANGGTIKVFYAEGSDVTFTHYQGRYYAPQFANTKPIAPTTPLATYVSDSQINLSWVDISNIEDGYRIYRKVDEGSYVELKTVGPGVESTSDDTVSANHKYQYKIVAYNGTAESDPIYTGAVYTTPAAPSGCAISLGTINVTWTDNSAYEDGFKIELELDGGGWNLVETTAAEAESWADTSQPTGANVRYQYRVRAYKGGLYSAYSTSNVLSVQVLAENLALKEEEKADISALLMESLALKESETVAISELFSESLALLESLPVLDRGLALEENLALKEDLTQYLRALLLEESLGLLESLPTLERALTLEESLALLEALTEESRALTLEEALALLESLPTLERALTLNEALALKEAETADIQALMAESLALKEDLTQLGRALTLEESLALLEDAHAETLLLEVDKDGNIIYMGTLDEGAF